MRWTLLALLAACAADAPEPEPAETSSGDEEPRLSAEAPPEEPPPEAASGELCTRVDFMTVTVPPDIYANRHGAAMTRFSELETSLTKPLEECGLPSVLGRLAQLQCDDGSLAYQSAGHAHSSRVGNMGPGGRCGAIIDLYRAQCGTTTFEVYADMYFCPSS